MKRPVPEEEVDRVIASAGICVHCSGGGCLLCPKPPELKRPGLASGRPVEAVTSDWEKLRRMLG